LKVKLKESIDKEKLLPKITEQAKKLRDATQDEKDIIERMKDRERERLRTVSPLDKNARQDNETQRDYLVRTGKITPFDHLPEATHRTRQYNTEATSNSVFPGSGHNDMSHKNLYAPSHRATIASSSSTSTQRKRKLDDEEDDDFQDSLAEDDEDEYKLVNVDEEDGSILLDSGDEDVLLADKKKHVVRKLDEIYNDDGSEMNYRKRLNDWVHNRKIMRYQVTHVNILADVILSI
jgi:DNA excision repair protein ERCC-6